MNTVLRISEAASIALHTMVQLAQDPGRAFTTHEVAESLDVSEAHLSKVLQRLSKAGLVNSVRGPNGGYRLAQSADDIVLQTIYEAIEGKLEPSSCLLGFPVCRRRKCVMGDFLRNMNAQFKAYLAENTLEDITRQTEGEQHACVEKNH